MFYQPNQHTTGSHLDPNPKQLLGPDTDKFVRTGRLRAGSAAARKAIVDDKDLKQYSRQIVLQVEEEPVETT